MRKLNKLLLHLNNENKEMIPIILKSKKNIAPIKKNKKFKPSLRKKISYKRIKKFNSELENIKLFFYTSPSLAEIQLNINLASFLRIYLKSNKVDLLYEKFIDDVSDESKYCTYRAYHFFYNKLAGKIQTYQLIDTDQGQNFVFSKNKLAKLASLFSHLFYFIPVPTLNQCSGGITRCGLKLASEHRKINKTKKKLHHCITDTNFIKLLSILLAKTHACDYAHQEKLELFLETRFKDFWSLFKRQAKEQPNKNLNQFWLETFVQYFKELKCSLQKKDFYNIVKNLIQACQKEENLKVRFITPQSQSASNTFTSLSMAFELLCKTLETKLQQEFFIRYIKDLIQIYAQKFAQQLLINSYFPETSKEKKITYKPLPELNYISTGFWQSKLPIIDTNYDSIYANPAFARLAPCQ